MPWARQFGFPRVHRRGMAAGGVRLLRVRDAFIGKSTDPVKFVCYLIAALLASSFQSKPAGHSGKRLSMNFLFTLIGILEMSLPETLLIGLGEHRGSVSIGGQTRRLKLVQFGLQCCRR